MSRSRDPLTLSPHWHVDYRIEAELPEDTIVGRRFLINGGFTILLIAALGWAGFVAFQTLEQNRLIRELERTINDSRPEVSRIDKLQADFDAAARKIDQAFTLVRPRLFVSGFVASIGRTRPPQMAIDLLDWNDTAIVLRGGLRERNTGASKILGEYVETLRNDPKLGPLFSAIQLTNVDRGSGAGMLRFEIKFSLKVAK
jgi:hypothetical protein